MKRLGLLLTALLLTACGQETYRLDNETSLIGGENVKKVTTTSDGNVRIDETSSTAGNLITTAMREVHNLDIALYPKDLINEENIALLDGRPTESTIESILSVFPQSGNKDQFRIGLMRGRDIKKLLRTRVLDNFQLDIEVAGMVYNVHTVAGVVTSDYYGLDNGRTFEDSETYRVAINHHFFFSGETFPSYKFRNGLNFSFVPNGQIFSAQDTLRKYLREVNSLPYLKAPRGRYSQYTLNSVGQKKTYEIQGNSHRSPYYGHKVTTSGIVTAVDNVGWYPRGVDIIIQDPNGDGIDETSDALNIHLVGDTANVRIGQKITVTGTVYEHMTLDKTQNMSKTVIREVTNLDNSDPMIYELPAPVVIGKQGRTIPNKVLSTWTGDLNFKPFLNLNDGIDFWESLEGMRVTINNPSVAGFRGGNEELVRLNPQRHLSLYIIPDGFARTQDRTIRGGITEDYMVGNFNPEVIHLSAGNLTADFARLNPSVPRNTRDCKIKGGILYRDENDQEKCKIPAGLLTTEYHYNVGDIFKGKVTGIVSYESNLFGGGEYTFVLPKAIFRYDEVVNNSEEAICVVSPIEYLSNAYTAQFSQGIANTSCKDIITQRKALNSEIKKEIKAETITATNISTSELYNTIIRPSFAKDKNGVPDKLINCLDVNLFRESMPFECRPQSKLLGKGRDLTVAAYNLENLAGNQDSRIKSLGEAVRNNLKCPDILSLVEIQDNNGLDLQGGADASITLSKVIKQTKCSQLNVEYKAININPLNHNEGGQPGGNIRVAMLYNSNRVKFQRWNHSSNDSPLGAELQETRISKDGNLTVNPGRVFPNAEAFKNTRKSIAAQFEFQGEKVFVIGNHFNSKLGDSSFWGATQPPFPESDIERSHLANAVNEFVRIIEIREPNANIIVLGDFNAYYNERSMITLENGGVLNNLMFYKNLVQPSDRYSHNFNGSSGAIDFIFVNKNLLKKNPKFQAVHINSDYMGRLADHDPVISRFSF